ncbi:hypothetical protein AMTR_s00099p00153840 [Amborella trichopoda]|uniref:Integrase catalytic domain-containing protein n=1 Tax=Amborella trichopoda TaxID=13333 RepID=W1NYM7_AMBTC|nr:hypothetical protein AMTR_s00099p00153840 [Amborella trichopoda]
MHWKSQFMVAVDKLSKYVTFMAAPWHCFFRAGHCITIVLHPPGKMVRCRERYCERTHRSLHSKVLFDFMGTKLNSSTSNCPQTVGQTEGVNALLNELLQHLATDRQPLAPHDVALMAALRVPSWGLSDVKTHSPDLEEDQCQGGTPRLDPTVRWLVRSYLEEREVGTSQPDQGSYVLPCGLLKDISQ